MAESTPGGTPVYRLPTENASQGETRWKLVDPSDNDLFRFDATTGTLSVAPKAVLDHETVPQIEVSLLGERRIPQSNSASLFLEDLRKSGIHEAEIESAATRQTLVTLRIEITDVAEAPVWNRSQQSGFAFDFENRLRELHLSASDADLGDSVQYSIVQGNDSGWLECDSDSGRIRMALGFDDQQLRGSAVTELPIVVRATDTSGLSVDQKLDLKINNSVAFLESLASRRVASTEESRARQITVAAATEKPAVIPATASKNLSSVATSTTTATGTDSVSIDPHTAATAVTTETSTDPGSPVDTFSSAVQIPSETTWAIVSAFAALLTIGFVSVTLLQARRRRLSLESAADQAQFESDANLMEDVEHQHLYRAQPGFAARQDELDIPSSGRSLRSEMTELLAVSKDFTVKQRARFERRCYSRKFRMAALVTSVVAQIAVGKLFVGHQLIFAQEDIVVLGCLAAATFAMLRSYMSIRQAGHRINAPGPLRSA